MKISLLPPRRLSAHKGALSLLGSFLLAASLSAAEVKVDLTDGWNFTNGQEYPGATGTLDPGADNTLVLSYNFSGGGQYVAADKKLDGVGDLVAVDVTAAGPGGNLGVSLIDSTGQTLIYRLGKVEAGSKTFDLPLGKPSDSYGGANDKTIHYPLQAMRLVVEKDAGLPEGKITFSSILLKTDK